MRNYEEMKAILSDIDSDSTVQEMKQYIQHGRVTTYEHCKSVAKLSYDINKVLALHADLHVLLVGAMLHDYYLYDWHNKDGGAHDLHGFIHAKIARDNARKHFGIDDRTCDVVYRHMWPLNISRIPRSREAWIVCAADKIVSLQETLLRR